MLMFIFPAGAGVFGSQRGHGHSAVQEPAGPGVQSLDEPGSGHLDRHRQRAHAQLRLLLRAAHRPGAQLPYL